MQGSCGTHSPLLHEHDKIHVPVPINENQTETSIESVIELPVDKEHGEENHDLVVSSPNVPTKISCGVFEQGYFCNLRLEQTGEKSVTLVCRCVCDS